MAFDVTAVNVIFFVAMVTAGSAWLGSQWKGYEDHDEVRRDQWDRTEDRVQTNLSVTSASYNAGATRFSVSLRNNGTTVIDVSELDYLVNGVLMTSSTIESVTVVGATSSDILLPGDTLEARFLPITSTPTRFKAVTASGAEGYWGA